ncbi:MAG: DUF4388 domain-containing protein, partial [Polyangiaceae bacterium]
MSTRVAMSLTPKGKTASNMDADSRGDGHAPAEPLTSKRVGFFSFLEPKKKRPLVRVPTYRGNLADTALPEMLAVVYRHGAAGLVEAAKGDIVKKIYVKDGTFIHATSTDPNDAVLPYLLRTGSLTAEQFSALNSIPVDSEKKR